MTEENIRRVRFWYGIFLSVFTAAIGILFLAEVADIYFSIGEFTRTEVGRRLLQHILAPFILWVLAVIAGFVLSVVFPVTAKRKSKPNAQKALSRLKRRLPNEEGLSEEQKQDLARVKKFELVRVILWSVSAAMCLAGAIACAVYVFDKTNFSSTDYNTHILAMAKFVLPFVIVSFACCIGTAVYEGVSAKFELPLVKKLVALGAPAKEQKECPVLTAVEKREKWIVLGVRIAVAVLAVVFIILGALNGGAGGVFAKAVKICTECIGLG